jgi:hypothetical protein
MPTPNRSRTTPDPGTRNQHLPCEEKFAGLLKTIAENTGSEIHCMIISEPWMIGDTHEEIIESVSRQAGSNLGLRIVRREAWMMNN